MKKLFLILILVIAMMGLYSANAMAQLKFYSVPDSLVYPKIYIVTEVEGVKNYLEMEKDLQRIKNRGIKGYILNDSKKFNIYKEYSLKDLPKLEYKQISNTEYEIKISKTSEPFILVLNQNFHSAWTLVIEQDSSKCDKILKEYERFNVVECDNSFKENALINNILRPYFDKQFKADHFLINGLVNAWYIQPHNNDLNFRIRFKVQEYFIFGLLVSSITIIFIVMYLIYDKFFKKGR